MLFNMYVSDERVKQQTYGAFCDFEIIATENNKMSEWTNADITINFG